MLILIKSCFINFKSFLRNPLRQIMLYFYHLKHLSFKKTNSKKTIVFCCDGFSQHGGLVDRLKGLISFYEVSKILDIDFKVHHISPYELDYFLSPNLVNWKTTSEDTKWHPFDTKFAYKMLDFDLNPLDYIKHTKKNKIFVYNNIDYLSKIYPNDNPDLLIKKWVQSYHELFKKSDLLQSYLNNFNLPEKRIAIHTRFTSSLGDFVDTDVPILSENQIKETIDDVINEINTYLSNKPESNIVVFSDSKKFIKAISEQTKYFTVSGEPVHLDNLSEKFTIEQHAKTFVDFYLIAESEEIVLFSKPKPIMYPSNFSRYASYLTGNKFKHMIIN